VGLDDHPSTARGGERRILLDVPRYRQPDHVTCGPTSLRQVYSYYGFERPLEAILKETPRNPDGGTLAVYLGIGALRNGFSVTSYSYNLRIFDPTWAGLRPAAMIGKLRQRCEAVRSKKLRRELEGYITFLKLGGQVSFRDLDRSLLVGLLREGKPILTGLSATHLYRTPRDFEDKPDDVRGEPVGHFVVICGYYPRSDKFLVCDPEQEIPFSRTGRYAVKADRLISAILLGDVTYDAVLLVFGRQASARGSR
jgi:hypothetical protein